MNEDIAHDALLNGFEGLVRNVKASLTAGGLRNVVLTVRLAYRESLQFRLVAEQSTS